MLQELRDLRLLDLLTKPFELQEHAGGTVKEPIKEEGEEHKDEVMLALEETHVVNQLVEGVTRGSQQGGAGGCEVEVLPVEVEEEKTTEGEEGDEGLQHVGGGYAHKPAQGPYSI